MSATKIPQVTTPTLFDKFEQHIDDDFNERILFSAPFGSGKSTFLKSYFENHPEYLVLKLYPVNYSIAQNQDVFELIKYDLLYELLDKFPEDVQLNSEQYSWLLVSQMYLLHQMKIEQPLKLLMKAAKTFAGAPPLPEEDIIDAVTSVIGDFSEYKSKLNATEIDQLNRFVKSFKNKKGHIHELDSNSELIIDLLGRVQNSRAKPNVQDEEEPEMVVPKTVLLIDDLDRLDPEHVFRLFNIFSAHYDEVNETNKFGFDKIIFVCDINNIQQMFAHKYGISAEFNGYIDKFYSSEIFRFDIKNYLKESIVMLLKVKTDLLKFFPDNGLDNSFVDRYRIDRHDGFVEIIEYVLGHFIDLQQVKIRNFQRFRLFAIPNQKSKYKNKDFHVVFYPLLVLIFNLDRFFARANEVEQALEDSYKSYPANYKLAEAGRRWEADDHGETLLRMCLPFIIDLNRFFNRDFEDGKHYTSRVKNEFGDNVYFHFTLKREFRYDYPVIQSFDCTIEDIPADAPSPLRSILQPNPFWFLYKAYQCIKINNFI